MITAFAAPVLVDQQGKDVLLERVPLSGVDSTETYSENWLQDLVYRHPSALPVGEIDDSFAQMVPLCREMPTPAGPVDVVYVTRDGRPAIVEAKLWRNPEARRKVIGQILDYAKELTRWDVEVFDAAVRAARRKEDGGAPKGLLDLVGLSPDSAEAARFHDSLTRSLRRGDVLLLIVGDGIREGVGAIAEFLEGHGSLHFTFGLVEMAIYRMPGGGQIVQPRVLAQSTIMRRIVVDTRTEPPTISETGGEEDVDAVTLPDTDQAEIRVRYRMFWEAFLRELELDDRSQPVGTPGNSTNQFFHMPKESGAWVSAYLQQSRNRAGVYLTFWKGPIGDRIYAALQADRAAVERELGVPVRWESDGRKHLISTWEEFPGELMGDQATAVRSRLAKWTNRYVSVFRPRLEKLAREVG